MIFEFSEDQKAIAEMADGLFRDQCSDEALREWDLSQQPMMAALWAQCQATGLHALAISEEQGGSGLGMTDLLPVLLAQGRHLGQAPLWQHQLAAVAIQRFADASQLDWVTRAASAEVLLTLNLDSLFNPVGAPIQATREGDQLVLNGQQLAVAAAAQADAALLPVLFEGHLRVALIDLSAPGVERDRVRLLNGETAANVRLNNLCLNQTLLLANEALDWLEQATIAALSALQLGVSEGQLSRTVEYVCGREQFGRPIGSFQAVQMSLADSKIAVEVLRSALLQLCYRLDAGLPAPSEARACAWQACKAGHLVGHKAQHLHGGMGVDVTYPIHRYLYWSRTLGNQLGGSDACLERLGDWLAHNNKLGWKYDLEENQAV